VIATQATQAGMQCSARASLPPRQSEQHQDQLPSSRHLLDCSSAGTAFAHDPAATQDGDPGAVSNVEAATEPSHDGYVDEEPSGEAADGLYDGFDSGNEAHPGCSQGADRHATMVDEQATLEMREVSFCCTGCMKVREHTQRVRTSTTRTAGHRRVTARPRAVAVS
jgi:hypothetical protein